MSPIFLGMALGAGSAFLLDPQQGRRRRALLRDRWTRTAREAREFGDAAATDLRGRARGLSVQMRSLRGGPVSDDVLMQRVRAKLGRYVSHPHAIRVLVQNGYVTLGGNVLQAEHSGLLGAVHSVPGVRDLMDRLDVHASAEGISALQEGAPAERERPEPLQRTWSPGTRALVAGAGALLTLYALARGGVSGAAALAGGAALIARAKMNRPLLKSERSVVDRQTEGYPAIGR